MGDYILDEVDKKLEEYEMEMESRRKLLNGAGYTKRTHALLSRVRDLRKELNGDIIKEDKSLDKIFYKSMSARHYFPLDVKP